MPHGVQWSWEDIRNAKRAAEYFNEAQRAAAWRAEAAAKAAAIQAEREAAQAQREAEIAKHDAEYEAKRARERELDARYAAEHPTPTYFSDIKTESKYMSSARIMAEKNAKAAKAAEYGSKEYIEARYGLVREPFGNQGRCIRDVLRALMQAEGLTEDQAWERIVANYDEENWRSNESQYTEFFLKQA